MLWWIGYPKSDATVARMLWWLGRLASDALVARVSCIRSAGGSGVLPIEIFFSSILAALEVKRATIYSEGSETSKDIRFFNATCPGSLFIDPKIEVK